MTWAGTSSSSSSLVTFVSRCSMLQMLEIEAQLAHTRVSRKKGDLLHRLKTGPFIICNKHWQHPLLGPGSPNSIDFLFLQLGSLELPLARFCLTKADKSTRSLIELSEEEEEVADSISFLSTLLSLLSLHSIRPDNRLNRLQICNCNWAHCESQTFAALVSAAAAAKQQKEKSAVHSGCSCSCSSSSALVSVIKSPLVPFNYIGRLGGWLREGKQQQPPHHFRLLLLLLLLISAIRDDFDKERSIATRAAQCFDVLGAWAAATGAAIHCHHRRLSFSFSLGFFDSLFQFLSTFSSEKLDISLFWAYWWYYSCLVSLLPTSSLCNETLSVWVTEHSNWLPDWLKCSWLEITNSDWPTLIIISSSSSSTNSSALSSSSSITRWYYLLLQGTLLALLTLFLLKKKLMLQVLTISKKKVQTVNNDELLLTVCKHKV